MAEQDAEDVAAAVLAMKHTCALDVADDGPQKLTHIGQHIGFSRERARQVFNDACERIGADPMYLQKHEAARMDAAIRAYLEGDPRAAAAEYGYTVANLRDLAMSRQPEKAKQKRAGHIKRSIEEKRALVEAAKAYPSITKAAAALGVAPASLSAWIRGRNMDTPGVKRPGAGRKSRD